MTNRYKSLASPEGSHTCPHGYVNVTACRICVPLKPTDVVKFNVGYIKGLKAEVVEVRGFDSSYDLHVKMLEGRGAYGVGDGVDCMSSEVDKQ